MENFGGIGKTLIIIGCVILLTGIIILLAGKIPFVGKLPGDFSWKGKISWKGKNWSVYFPLGTSILISIILTLIFWLIKKFN
jgi:hypothetical protein